MDFFFQKLTVSTMEEPLLESEGKDGKRGGAEVAASVYAELYQVRVCPRCEEALPCRYVYAV
jgi:hypothetical protein